MIHFSSRNYRGGLSQINTLDEKNVCHHYRDLVAKLLPPSRIVQSSIKRFVLISESKVFFRFNRKYCVFYKSNPHSVLPIFNCHDVKGRF